MTYMGETKVLTVCEDTPILEAALKVSCYRKVGAPIRVRHGGKGAFLYILESEMSSTKCTYILPCHQQGMGRALLLPQRNLHHVRGPYHRHAGVEKGKHATSPSCPWPGIQCQLAALSAF